MFKFNGIIPPIITPFAAGQEVHEEALREHVSFLIENGVHGLFTCSVSGEFFSLKNDERKRVNRIVVDEANGKVPVLAGTGASSTIETIELTKHAKDVGADAAVIIAPPLTRATDEGLLIHYKTLMRAVDIPIVLYNAPARTGINLSPSLVAETARMENVVGIKDTCGDMAQFSELVTLVGDKISVFQCEDQLILMSLFLGAKGAAVSVANIAPKLVVNLYRDFLESRIEEARKKQMLVNRLMKEVLSLNYRPWPAPIKEALNLLGRRAGVVRSPLVGLDEDSRNKIGEALAEFKKLGIF